MAYVITGSCVKDDSCLDVCPVDAIHAGLEVPDQHGWAEEVNMQFFAERALG